MTLEVQNSPELNNDNIIDGNEIQSISNFLENTSPTEIKKRMEKNENGDKIAKEIIGYNNISKSGIEVQKSYLNVIKYLSDNELINNRNDKKLEELDNKIKMNIVIDMATDELITIYKKKYGPNIELDEETLKNIKNNAEKQIYNDMGSKDIDAYYTTITVPKKGKFKKIVNGGEKSRILKDILTDNNRSYLLGQFAEAFGSMKEKSHIEDFIAMLEKTPDNVINEIAINVATYPKANLLKNLWIKILEDNNGKFDKTAHFVTAKNTHDTSSIKEPKYTGTGTTRRYTQQLIERSDIKIKSIETTQKLQIEDALQVALNNTNTTNININFSQLYLAEDIKTIINSISNPLDIPINLNPVDGLQDLQISTIEKIETQKTISETLNNLEANAIGPNGNIENIIQNNEELSKIMNDPAYKIVGGNITGFASRNPTTYKNHNPIDFDKYNNNTINYEKPINSNDRNITNNPELAYNRAANFIDYFLSQKDKVTDGANFNLDYKVNGPTRNDIINTLKEKNGKTPSDEQIKNEFLSYQNAKINLNVIKTEYKSNITKISLDNTEITRGRDMIITIRPKDPKPMSPPSGKRKSWGSKFKVIPGGNAAKQIWTGANSCRSFKNCFMAI